VNRIELFDDHYQNYKKYGMPKAQLLIADIPYNVGIDAYGSNPAWYKDGDRENGESDLAGKPFFNTDMRFKIPEFFFFCSRMLKKEPKERGKAPCMIVFCSFEQQFELIEHAKENGFNHYINLVFRKNFSAQVLKANMRVVGNCEYALILYRDKLPKFNNHGNMVFNCLDWVRDNKTPKIHPCLPAGEKVFINKQWKNIESVKIGDFNKYGDVINISAHYAEKIIKIQSGRNVIKATWNHPFLIKRNTKVYWMNAEQIVKGDYVLTTASVYGTLKPYKTIKEGILCRENTRKQKKGISDMQKMKKGNCVLNIFLFGKNSLEKFLMVCRCIIKILTKQTIKFPICNLSMPLNTSGCTQVVDLSMENGKSLVRFVENIKNVIKKIGIIPGGGLTEEYVSRVILRNHWKQERYLLQKVGSVKIINGKTKVYNLTISNIPIFDTLIGLSHNTQKPVPVLEKLIEVFTDENDVVIDPVAGSCTTLLAAKNLNRRAYGFEIIKEIRKAAREQILTLSEPSLFAGADATEREVKQKEMF